MDSWVTAAKAQIVLRQLGLELGSRNKSEPGSQGPKPWIGCTHLEEGWVGFGVDGLIPVPGFTLPDMDDVVTDGNLVLVERRRPRQVGRPRRELQGQGSTRGLGYQAWNQKKAWNYFTLSETI